ncbi:MAG TPA: hypothetical protein VN859_06210, partial [Steroidobacteraceae bacterium]|nr:hypothetical protein [Steroidobacteraceae bacterium]
FVAAIAIAGVAVATALPLFGLTNAALLVFLGILNYVAYRDIFERRSENTPQLTPAAYVAGRPAAVPIIERALERHSRQWKR